MTSEEAIDKFNGEAIDYASAFEQTPNNIRVYDEEDMWVGNFTFSEFLAYAGYPDDTYPTFS